ncbi:hypothetical protein V2A60_002822 [Cordyceps javanica]|uniref:L-ornithine N(5)-monooxygenase [NAD(P)H] n=1 Tax=Cordyceps javanica TaxID=43265 RepID=A0A545UXB4_9HYPO|nr:L-ornithine 5-monooxygenase [Cordyceps javanica]TQW05991.1 L-ornithine 5-monooxygenase [Cordyceps javanica]
MSPHRETSGDESTAATVHQNGTNGTAAPELVAVPTNGTAPTNGAVPTNGAATAPESLAVKNGVDSRVKPIQRSSHLVATDLDAEYDLVCVGFGPASLSVAIALHDSLAAGKKLRPDGSAPKVLFLEKQTRFAWHAGMLLPGAKMQISFVKDLATLRDPRSHFTFLNYLHQHDRLVDFTNLGTFLPARIEYEDYMRWCSSHFEHLVQYDHEVVSVTPAVKKADTVKLFTVEARDNASGQMQTFRGRNVLLATGGKPSFPKSFPIKHPRILHSSQYAYMVPKILSDKNAAYKVVVVGAGQSAAEIFHNIQNLYPNSSTQLVMRQEFLKPSDDSPFVNSIFNPEYIDSLFPKSAKDRSEFLVDARATNYGVVRLELIEELFERMYSQKRTLGPDERSWPHRIMGCRQISNIESNGERLEVKIHGLSDGVVNSADEEILSADLIIAATGYQRNAHIDMLKSTWDMLPKAVPGTAMFNKGVTGWNVDTEQGERKIAVGRDYRVQYKPGTVAADAGIWLQGCCEGTHGLSDTLLSVLATRSGEIVESIFGSKQ